MLPSEIEIRLMTRRHLKGGVAPSRHALNLRTYVESQRDRARAKAAVSIPAAFRPAVAYLAAGVNAFLAYVGTLWSAGRRTG